MTSRNGDDEIFGQGFLQDRLAELDGSGDDPFAGPNIEDVDWLMDINWDIDNCNFSH